MKVLIITYYWPPAGGSGVQRWLKFVKYLQGFDIEPIVYTVDNANYPKEDASLVNEIPKDVTILKQPIWEPTDVLFWKKKNQQKKDISNSTNSGFLSFIRGNFFIPDPKIFWVKPSVKFLNQFLKEKPVDVVISTGPPHSMHLIAKKISQKNNIKWLADFRDPWSDLYYNKEFNQLSFAKKRNIALENSVFNSTDCLLTVSNTLKMEFTNKTKRVEVITNGFDDEVATKNIVRLDKKFTISYIGLLPKQSNPKLLFTVLQKLCLEDAIFKNDLQLNFIGDISDEVKKEIEFNNLIDNTEFKGYVSHREAIVYQKKAQVLLLLIPNVKKSEGILTGKLFEYLTAKRPILALGPEKADLSEILENTNAGVVVGFNNEVKLTSEIKKLYQQYKEGSLQVNSKNVEQYHRINLTGQLAIILKSMKS
ncbi:glycosyl transferase family 1 [Polaribacter reichenbachii]|uniref:Glycosyl transferase family 1 n=1 Tax=Polaribacter reichenbachii TaxID=996801 RepID=A0A1B8U5M1_9FLAO|nr:glycosyltransferase family 4 protein [Polaribacter reichenbachii]APZ46603.1 glycosyl transferase family 1 [Polaribacter reichenbachii]AUC17248.1 glycosyl transferase family 1 [Polaribacter reichenbachii]OBY67154.1 glycosyl transferase family 1 [Polaribacter reichenbachii]